MIAWLTHSACTSIRAKLIFLPFNSELDSKSAAVGNCPPGQRFWFQPIPSIQALAGSELPLVLTNDSTRVMISDMLDEPARGSWR